VRHRHPAWFARAAWSLLEQEPENAAADERDLHRLSVTLHAAITLHHSAAARVLGAQLACLGHLATGDWFHMCMARLLGQAAVLDGDRATASSYFVQALVSADTIGFRPEIALSHLHISEVFLEDHDLYSALQHLDTAVPELEDMLMRPALATCARSS